MWGLDECKNIKWILLWRTDEGQGTGKTQHDCLPWMQGLNKCHAPISRIKPFEHLLSLILPLFVLWWSLTVNDFLKISVFHIRFTCLKCLVEQTQVCKVTIAARLTPMSVWAEPRNLISKARLIKRKQTRYKQTAFQFLLVYISGLCSHPFQRESPPAKTITPHPHPSTRLSLTASTQYDNQAH